MTEERTHRSETFAADQESRSPVYGSFAAVGNTWALIGHQVPSLGLSETRLCETTIFPTVHITFNCICKNYFYVEVNQIEIG